MRYVALAVFIFILNVSMAFINATGVFMHYGNPNYEWLQEASQTEIQAETYNSGQVTTSDIDNFGDFVKGLWYFIKSFAFGVICFSYTLEQFGLTYPFTWLLNSIVYLLYLLGIAQFMANRATKSMG